MIYDRPNQKGKYRLVEPAKLPSFLSFRTRNKTWSIQIMKDLFSSTTEQEKFKQFANNIGIYILYVLIKRTRPEGPWTAKAVNKSKSNDPRMKDIDLLHDTCLIDTINPSFLVEQFNKYVNNNNQTYQELLQTFESTFPDIYNKIEFHEHVDKMRELKKKEKKNKKQPEIPDEELTKEEIDEIDTEIYDKGIEGYYDSLDRKNKKNKSVD